VLVVVFSFCGVLFVGVVFLCFFSCLCGVVGPGLVGGVLVWVVGVLTVGLFFIYCLVGFVLCCFFSFLSLGLWGLRGWGFCVCGGFGLWGGSVGVGFCVFLFGRFSCGFFGFGGGVVCFGGFFFLVFVVALSLFLGLCFLPFFLLFGFSLGCVVVFVCLVLGFGVCFVSFWFFSFFLFSFFFGVGVFFCFFLLFFVSLVFFFVVCWWCLFFFLLFVVGGVGFGWGRGLCGFVSFLGFVVFSFFSFLCFFCLVVWCCFFFVFGWFLWVGVLFFFFFLCLLVLVFFSLVVGVLVGVLVVFLGWGWGFLWLFCLVLVGVWGGWCSFVWVWGGFFGCFFFLGVFWVGPLPFVVFLGGFFVWLFVFFFFFFFFFFFVAYVCPQKGFPGYDKLLRTYCSEPGTGIGSQSFFQNLPRNSWSVCDKSLPPPIHPPSGNAAATVRSEALSPSSLHHGTIFLTSLNRSPFWKTLERYSRPDDFLPPLRHRLPLTYPPRPRLARPHRNNVEPFQSETAYLIPLPLVCNGPVGLPFP